MKRLMHFLFFIAIALNAVSQDLPLVISTASMINDMAKNIGGEHFRYDVIVPIGGDPHIYEPTPRDARICHDAQLILKNGLTFEGWLDKLIDNSGTKAQAITVTKGIAVISSQQYANATDPHAWMDASNGLIYAQNIRNAMIDLLPSAENTFRTNYEAYKTQIESADQYIYRKIQAIPEGKRILITSHDAFQYFGRRYGIQLEAVMGTSTDAEVQTSDIKRLGEVINSTMVPAVFVESTINPRLLEQIAEDNDVAVGGKLYADSLSDEEGPAGTYLKMLRYNADTIFEGLNQDREGSSGKSKKAESGQSFNWLWILFMAPIIFAITLFVIRMVRQ